MSHGTDMVSTASLQREWTSSSRTGIKKGSFICSDTPRTHTPPLMPGHDRIDSHPPPPVCVMVPLTSSSFRSAGPSTSLAFSVSPLITSMAASTSATFTSIARRASEPSGTIRTKN